MKWLNRLPIWLLALYLFSTLLLWIASCSPDQTQIQFVRHPLFSLVIGSQSVQAQQFQWSRPVFVAVYPSDTSPYALPYYRYTLQAAGILHPGITFQLSIVFDVKDTTKWNGSYMPVYTPNGGLHNVILYQIDSAQHITTYSLKPIPSRNVFTISRQGRSERLIAGSFAFVLQNDQDTSQTLNIQQGQFADLSY
jgi:hypothetical protein